MANDRVLIIATSSKANVLQALETLTQRVFINARAELLCTLADLPCYDGNSKIERFLVFPSRHDWRSIQQLRRHILEQRYQAIAVLWCRQTKWMRPKGFALTCGLRRLLVFNENLDCDFLHLRYLVRLFNARLRSGPTPLSGISGEIARSALSLLGVLTRALLFPLRLFALLMAGGLLLLDKPHRGRRAGKCFK
jgi:hypothetical protein